MQTNRMILNNTLIETIGSPCFSKETKGNSLTKTIELETATTTSIHNGSIVNHFNINIAFLSTNPKIRVSSSTKNEMNEKQQTQRHHQQQGMQYCRQQHYRESFQH